MPRHADAGVGLHARPDDEVLALVHAVERVGREGELGRQVGAQALVDGERRGALDGPERVGRVSGVQRAVLQPRAGDLERVEAVGAGECVAI